MYASTGEQKYKDRVEYIMNDLDEIQKVNGNGYLMCVPRGKELFREISEGQINVQRFNLNGCWAPLYTMHKIMSGLRDAYRLCSNEKALEIEKKFADWLYEIIDDLNDEQMQKIMYCEHGGIAESLADLAADTGNKKYMDMALKFHHKEMWDPMIEQRDILAGNLANTLLP
jgi:DUF1680 family protein